MFSDSITSCRLVLPQFLAVSFGFCGCGGAVDISESFKCNFRHEKSIHTSPFSRICVSKKRKKEHLDICSLSLLAHTQYVYFNPLYICIFHSVQFSSIQLKFPTEDTTHRRRRREKKSSEFTQEKCHQPFRGPILYGKSS